MMTENRLQYSTFVYRYIQHNLLCTCSEIEDPFHFLFECSQYNLIRRDVLTCLSAICNEIFIYIFCYMDAVSVAFPDHNYLNSKR